MTGLVAADVSWSPVWWSGLLVLVALSFLIGSVNPASLVARALGTDIRGGSGNPGATNAGRLLGARWGVLVGLLDVLKGWAPTGWALHVAGFWVAAACGLAAVAGHIWSPFLRGHGGKGVATALGAMLAMDPGYAVVALVAFVLALPMVRRTGLASVVACIATLVVGVLVGVELLHLGPQPASGWWLVVVSALVLWRHRTNIRAWVRAARS